MQFNYYNFSGDIKKKQTFVFISDLHCRNSEQVLEKIEEGAKNKIISQSQNKNLNQNKNNNNNSNKRNNNNNNNNNNINNISANNNPTAIDNIDAVLIAGDVLHNSELYNEGLRFLNSVSKKYPTFCSLGNHETRIQNQDIINKIYNQNAVILNNDYVLFNGIILGGLTSGEHCSRFRMFSKTPAPDLNFINKFSNLSGYKILLSHHPEYYGKYLKDKNINLILSGHAHGGQWRLFNRGFFATGQGFFPKYTSGMYGNMIVNRGLSHENIFPRINNPTEIIYITVSPFNK